MNKLINNKPQNLNLLLKLKFQNIKKCCIIFYILFNHHILTLLLYKIFTLATYEIEFFTKNTILYEIID